MAQDEATTTEPSGPLKNVRALCRNKGATRGKRRTMARDAGVPLDTLEKLFSDNKVPKAVPKDPVLNDIAAALGCSYDEVFIAFNLDIHPEAERCMREASDLLRHFFACDRRTQVALLAQMRNLARRR
jgi:hypothetical protein